MRRVGVYVFAVGGALLAPTAIAARIPADKPPPSASRGRAPKPDKPPKTNPSSGTAWLGRADAVCVDGLRARKALIVDVSRHPSSTARRTLLRILAGTGLVEDRMLRRLAKVHPPRSDRTAFGAALRIFRNRHFEDKRLVAALKRSWDVRRLQRQTRRDRLQNGRLIRLWDDLGAAGCIRYFRSLRA